MMAVERNRKVEPAAKKRNCFRERAESMVLLELGWEGSSDGLGDGSVIVESVGRWRKAIPLVSMYLLEVEGGIHGGLSEEP